MGRSGVVVVGDALVELVPSQACSAYRARLGGAPYNVAIGLARLGAVVYLKARLSSDRFGRELQLAAQVEGVRLDYSTTANGATSIAVIKRGGANCLEYRLCIQGSADWQWSSRDLAPVPADASIAHFGSLASWLPGSAEAIRGWISSARALGLLISYEPSIHAGLVGDLRELRSIVEANVAVSDIVKVTSGELATMYPGKSSDFVSQMWIDLGASLVVVVDGVDTVSARLACGRTLLRAGAGLGTLDTDDASDAFTSGFLYGLAAHGITSRRQLDSTSGDVVHELLDRAAWLAVLACAQ